MIVACTKCHHEAQATRVETCDWCGAEMVKIGSDYMDKPGYLNKLVEAVSEMIKDMEEL